MSIVAPKGVIKIVYEDTNNEKFTETPFRTNANVLDGSQAADTIMSAMYTAIGKMSTLASATVIEPKIVYEVPIIDNP